MKKRLFSSVLLFFIFFISHLNASCVVLLQVPFASHLTDSLLQALKTAPDAERINTLNTLSRQFLNTGDYEEALRYADQAQLLAKEHNDKMELGNAYSNKGVIFWYLGESDKALENHLQAIKIRNQCVDIQGVANSYNNIGLVYLSLSDYERSLQNYLKSLKIREETGDKNGMANSYNNIGVIYQKQNNYEKAIENYEKALKIREALGDKFGIAMSYNNIGLIYIEKNEYLQAIKNLMKGLLIREEIGDKKGMADSYLNVGTLYYKQEKYEKALEFFFKSAGINERIGNKRGIGISYTNIGTCYLYRNQLENALLYLNKGIALLKAIGNRDGLKDAYSALSAAYDKKGDYKKAYDYQAMYADLKDTLFDEQVSEQMAEMNAKYESERKNKELIKKDAEIARQQAETEKQRIVRNAFIISFVLLAILAFFIYRGYRQKKKANKLLDDKNEKITDSINYAKHIQESIFPPVNEIKQHLPDFFVLLQPKDIVSGDFYWFAETPGSQSIILAAVDCTGHGVPGAFMSLLNISYLNEAIIEKRITSPEKILDYVRGQIISSLNPEGSDFESKDGMDAVLCVYDFKGLWLRFACANNPLWIVRKNDLIKFKPDKMPVGMHYGEQKPFTANTIGLRKGDIVYTFTDGYADQFGGTKGEKFKYNALKELLLSIQDKSMEEQKEILENTFESWKGDLEQVDDVLVIGIRV